MEARLQQETPNQRRKKRMELALYADYIKEVSNPNQSKTMLIHYLMDKYEIGSAATVYAIIKRVENNLSKEGGKL